MTVFIRNTTARALADLIDDHVNGGCSNAVINIYDGSVPADADTAIAGQTLLAELTMSDPAFGAAQDAMPGAVITADTITSDASANATGTATFLRILDSDSNVIMQMSVGEACEDVNFNTTSFVMGGQIDITSLTVTVPE